MRNHCSTILINIVLYIYIYKTRKLYTFYANVTYKWYKFKYLDSNAKRNILFISSTHWTGYNFDSYDYIFFLSHLSLALRFIYISLH